MADSGPSARSVANSVLNSTSPSYGGLERAIRQGDQANPRAGFSYLDNIANILADKNDSVAGDVLLEQLLGRPPAMRHPYGPDEFIQPIPSDLDSGVFLYEPGATDTTQGIKDRRHDFEKYFQLPLDRGDPDAGYFGKRLQKRRGT